MPPRHLLAPLALGAALLIPAAPAPGAAVTAAGGEIRFHAPPGEVNRAAVSTSETFVAFRNEGGAGISPGAGCHLTGDGVVECPIGAAGVTSFHADLGDGDDYIDTWYLRRHDGPHPPMTIDAGDGHDEVRTGAFSSDPDKLGVIVRGGPGNDRIRSGGILEGGDGDDRVIGSYGYSHDRLDGGEGDDYMDGGPAPDTVSGGPGNDFMYEDFGERTSVPPNWYPLDDGDLDGGPGHDTMAAAGKDSTIMGGPGDDDILSNAKLADGGEGNDRMRGGFLLRGGPGDDHLSGSWWRPSRVYHEGCCNNTDTMEGGPGADRVEGANVHAIVDGGEGPDVLVPGSATDTLSYRSRGEPVEVDLGVGYGGLADEGDRVAPGFERFEGTAGDDFIIAGGGVHVDGWLGADTIIGTAGPDRLDGGGDGDVIHGGAGDDELNGGVDSITDPVTRATTRVKGDDTIDAGPGDDRITPRGGDDFVLAGSGDDRILATERADPFAGLPLNHSHIIQMSGADQVWCGKGLDGTDADYADSIALDCEVAAEGTPRWREIKVRPRRALRLTVRCAWADARPCKGTASLRTAAAYGAPDSVANLPGHRAAPTACRSAAGKVLARAGFRIRAGRVNYVHLKLTAAGERLVRKRGCVAVHAALSYSDAHARAWLSTRSLVLKRGGFRVPAG